MIFFKLFFWFCLLTNNSFYVKRLSQYDWFYYLVKKELKDCGFFDETNYPSKDFVVSSSIGALINVRDLDLPHYSYVYKYSIYVGENSPYYHNVLFIDQFSFHVENNLRFYGSGPIREYWQYMQDYIKISRYVYDKLDDVSRPYIPMWQKRIYLSNIKNRLGHDDYENLNCLPPVPHYLFPEIK